MSFDLLTEPWIPVTMTDGSSDTLSLREVFTQAASIRRIASELPTMSFAITRVLLAICHDAIGLHHHGDIEDLIDDGLPIDRIQDYLTSYADRFDLFHPERPFFQVADLRTGKGEASPLNKMISDVPNGAPFLTTRGGTALESISAAEAARWLVHTQAFDPSGIRSAAVGDQSTTGGKGYPIGPSWAGQIGGVVLHGESLAETLTFNLAPTPENPDDRPVWAKTSPQTEQRQLEPAPAGPVELLVWQSRRIKMVGDRGGVTGIVLAQGDKMTPQNRQMLEHMSAWRYSKPQTKKFGIDVYMPLKHDPSRSAWRGAPNLFGFSSFTDEGKQQNFAPLTVDTLRSHDGLLAKLPHTVTIELVGMDYGAQEAVVAELVHDTLDFRLGVLGTKAGHVRTMVNDVIAATDKCVWALGAMASNIASASGDFDGVEGARDQATLAAWSAIDSHARAWLAGLTENSDTIETRRDWQKQLRRILTGEAARLAANCPPAAITGRKTNRGFMTAAKAESYFHHTLRKELPLAYEEEKEMVS